MSTGMWSAALNRLVASVAERESSAGKYELVPLFTARL